MDFSLVPFTAPLTEAQTQTFLAKLWRLLARQTERYTMAQSSSVPVETAQELLASICYTLQFEMAQAGITPQALLQKDLYTVLRDGQTHLAAKVADTKRLWEAAWAQNRPETRQALIWIGCFFQKYDLYFFAHQTPWDMGFPLLEDVPEALPGISHVEAYLKRIHPAP